MQGYVFASFLIITVAAFLKRCHECILLSQVPYSESPCASFATLYLSGSVFQCHLELSSKKKRFLIFIVERSHQFLQHALFFHFHAWNLLSVLHHDHIPCKRSTAMKPFTFCSVGIILQKMPVESEICARNQISTSHQYTLLNSHDCQWSSIHY